MIEFFNQFGNNEDGSNLMLLKDQMESIIKLKRQEPSYTICDALFNEHMQPPQYQ